MMLAFGKYAVCLPLFHYMTRQEVLNADGEVLVRQEVLYADEVLPHLGVLCDGGVLPRQEVLYEKRDLHMLK